MSESVAKATRRDLRRAMGSAAVDRVVLHERAIEEHGETLRLLSKRLALREQEIHNLQSEQTKHWADIEDLRAQQADVAAVREGFQSWRARLRWILSGR